MKTNLVEGEFDAVLSLLDRQVLDAEGYLVCKVDDLELVEDEDGSLRLTAILVGPAALLPRFSGGLGKSLLEQWRRLGPEQAQRTTPWRISLDLVDKVGTAVELSVNRDDVLRKPDDRGETAAPRVHRLDHLLGMDVRRHGRSLGRVLDVRVAPRGRDLVCRDLIVGHGRPGSMLGYDRSADMGPAPLSHLIRWLHRHTGQLALGEVERWSWSGKRLDVRGPLTQLTHV